MSDTPKAPVVLAWTDLETTGLNPHEDYTLEVGCFLTGIDGKRITEDEYTAVVLFLPNEVNNLRATTIPYVNDMHETNGLWAELPHGKPQEQVEAELLAFITAHAPNPGDALMAGSSPRLDQNFTEVDFPSVGERLHYRSVDVSGLREVLVGNGLAEPLPDTAESTHRALPDIRRSHAEYVHLLGQLARKADLDAALAERDDYRARWQRACTAQANMQGAVESILNERNALVELLRPILAAWSNDYDGRQASIRATAEELAEALEAAVTATTPPPPPAGTVPDDASSLLGG